MLEAQNTLFFRLTPIAAALVALSAPASATTITWGGGTGDWYSTITPDGWAGNNVPDITDIAVINSGTITGIDTDVTVAGLSLNGGTLSGSGSLATSVLNWLSGTQTGNGITTVSGDAMIGSETYNIQYLGSSSSSGRTLNLNGDTSFQNAEFYMGGGSVINNNGTLTSKGTSNWIGSGGTFNNVGSFVQDATYSTMMMLTFNNTGSVNVQSGTLELTGGTSTGSFTTQSGQTLLFGYANETYNLTAGSLSNMGNMLFSGTVNLDSNTVTYSGNGNVRVYGTFNINGTGNLTASSVSQIGGTISGSFITSELDWRGGTQTGSGTTTVNGTAMLGFGYPNYSDPNYSSEETPGLYLGSSSSNGRTLNLNGDTSFQSNALYLSDSTVNNNGTFTSKGYDAGFGFGIYGGGIYSKEGTGNTFNNAGSFVQDVSGNEDYRKRTTIGVAFNNTGSVNVKSGTLSLSDGTSTGSFTTQPGQTLEFADGTYNLTAGSLSNMGNMRVYYGAVVNLDSNTVTYSGNGNVQVNHGTFNINGTGNLTASSVSQFGGTISGSFITSELYWSSGTQTGGGTTTVNGNTTFGSYNAQSLGSSASSTRTLNLNGESTFQSNGLYLSHASVINNTGTFTSKGSVQGSTVKDNFIRQSSGTGGSFNNAGTFIQDASGKTTSVSVAFNNTGSVNVKSGILQLDNLSNYDRTTQTLSGGSYEVQDGQTLAINLGTSTNRILTNSADITLNGTNARILHISGSNNALSALATNTTAGSLTLLNGAALSTGAFANAGAVTVGNSSSFASTGNYVQSAGSTVVHGDLLVGLVDIQGGSLFGNGTITGNLTNAGLVNPGASPGTLTALGNFTQLADGILISEIAGITQGISYDWLNISGTSSLAGTLDIYFTAGYLPNAGDSYTLLSYGGWDQTMFDEVRVNGLDDLARYSILYSDTGVTFSIVAVPEPSAYALLLAGLGFIGFMTRRKRQQA